MTTQNLYSATLIDTDITGFIFTDLESYQTEYDHLHALFGTEEYELQAIVGNQINQELFNGLHINQTNLTEWFTDIQHLTNEEKVGLWFLVVCCGLALTPALDAIRDGITIFHGSKQDWIGAWHKQASVVHGQHCGVEAAGSVLEFSFGGQTWCGNAIAS